MARDSRAYTQAWDEIDRATSVGAVASALRRARASLSHQPNLSLWLDSHALDQLEKFPHFNFACPPKRRGEDDLDWTSRCADAFLDRLEPAQERLLNSAVTKKQRRVLRQLHNDLVEAEDEGRAYGYDHNAIQEFLDEPDEGVDAFLGRIYQDVSWHQGHADRYDDGDYDAIYEQLVDQGMTDEELIEKEAIRRAEQMMRERFDVARRMIQDTQNELFPPRGLPKGRSERMRSLNALKRRLTSLK